MILSCNWEEMRALAAGAELLLSASDEAGQGAVAAPAEALAQIELLQPRLHAPLSIPTLADQRAVRRAVAAIREGLHDRLDEKVIEFHPAHEEAVATYFDYAHATGVLSRLDEMGTEMAAMIELITGAPATEATARTVAFPD